MGDGISQGPLRRFNKHLTEYARLNQRANGPLLESRAQRLRFSIFRGFKATMPTREQIQSEVDALPYSGPGSMKRRVIGGIRVSRAKEIQLRKSSRGFLGASWIIRNWKTSKVGQNQSFPAPSKHSGTIGFAHVRTSEGIRNPFVRLTSLLEGAYVINKSRGIIDKAIDYQVRDMGIYIKRKMAQRAKKTFRRSYRAFGP